jgi:hypothetical protein
MTVTNTGDAGDQYRGCLRFGTTTAEGAQGPSLDQLLAEEEPDPVQDALGGSDGSYRRSRRELAQLVSGDGSHSRTDPDLVGVDRSEAGLSAEEAALHVIPQGPAPGTAE